MAKRNPPALLLYWLLCGSALCLVRNHFDFFKDTFTKKKVTISFFFFSLQLNFQVSGGSFPTQERHKHIATFLKKKILVIFLRP